MKTINKYILVLTIIVLSSLLIADEWSDYGTGSQGITQIIKNPNEVIITSQNAGGSYTVMSLGGSSGTTIIQQGNNSPFNYLQNNMAESIDPKTGAITLTQKDISFTGKSGLKLEINRIYSSKQFNLIPKGIQPYDQDWHGWMGYGWQTNIGGRLIVATKTGSIANKPDMAILNIDGGSHFFSDSNRDGIFESQAKGSFDYIKRHTDGSYIYYNSNGIKYYFKTRYYYRTDGVDNYHNNSYDWNGTITGLYLDKIEDIYGAKINYTYEKWTADQSNNYSRTQKHEEMECVRASVSGFNISIDNECGSWYLLFGGYYEEPYYYNVNDYTEYNSYLYSFFRPTSIVHSDGYGVSINYINPNSETKASLISTITCKYNNISKTYKYNYDSNGLLTNVESPLNIINSYSYEYKNQSQPDGFNDKGFILSSYILPSTAKTIFTYSWYNPKTDPSNPATSITDEAAKNQSSYIISKLERNNGYTRTFSYSSGSGIAAADANDNTNKDLAVFYFRNVSVSDLDGSEQYVFSKGQLIQQKNQLGHTVDYTYTADDNRLVSMTTTRGSQKTKIEYTNFDTYLYPQKTINYGDLNNPNDDIATEVRYFTKAEMQAKNAPYYGGLVKEKWSYNVNNSALKFNWVKYEYNYSYPLCYLPSKKSIITKYNGVDTPLDVLYQYDYIGRPISETAPKNIIKTTIYDDINNSIESKLTYGGVNITNKLVYDKYLGVPLAEYKEGNLIAQYEYDLLGRKISEIKYGNKTTMEYDLLNRKTTITELRPNQNRITTIYYDPLGNVTKVIAPDSAEIVSEYDIKSRLVKEIREDGLIIEHFYNNLGQEISTKMNGKTIKQLIISADNSWHQEINALNQTKQFFYDPTDQLIKVIDTDGQATIKYTYNGLGQLISVTDAKNNTTQKTYDENGKLKTLTKPDGSIYTYTYDLYGNLIKEVRPGNSIIEYEYDDLNRNTKISYQKDNRELTTTYYRGGNWEGLVASSKDDSGLTQYYYDYRGRLIKKDTTILGKTYTQFWEYDNYDKCTIYTDASNTKTYYTYKTNNDLLAKIETDINNQKKQLAEYTYNPNKTITKIDYGNDSHAIYQYDNSRRVKAIEVINSQNINIFKHVYTYDDNNNRLGMTYYDERTPSGDNYTYDYDVKGQLTSIKYPNQKTTFQYKYDINGNRLSFNHAFGTINYTSYEANSDRLSEYTDNGIVIKCTYDAEGNLAKKVYLKANSQEIRQLNYQFNSSNQLFNAKVNDYFDPQKNVEYIFTYNALGDMVIKKRINDNQTQVFHQSGRQQTTVETDGAGNISARIIYGADGNVLTRLDFAANTISLKYYHNDVQGNTIKITDPTGKVLQTTISDPFGNVELSYGKETSKTTLYTNKERYADIELIYFGARWYDPAAGRFISEDPVDAHPDQPLSFNKYIYCLNNPLKYIDPTGEDFWESVLGFLGEFAGMWIRGMIADAIEAIQLSLQYSINSGMKYQDALTKAFGDIQSGWGETDGAVRAISSSLYEIGMNFLGQGGHNSSSYVGRGDPGDITTDIHDYYRDGDGNLAKGDISIKLESDWGLRAKDGRFYLDPRSYGPHAGYDRQMTAGKKVLGVYFSSDITTTAGPNYHEGSKSFSYGNSYYAYLIVKNNIEYHVSLYHIDKNWQCRDLADKKYKYTDDSYYCEPHVHVEIKRTDNNAYVNPEKIVKFYK